MQHFKTKLQLSDHNMELRQEDAESKSTFSHNSMADFGPVVNF